jgi:uracil-DNA glycosylase family 4
MGDSLRKIRSELIECRACPRLVEHREDIARRKRRAYQGWTYWGRPVPAFGEADARLVLVGLAPGAHGSNRTGRMFTGDASGDFLFEALHRYGFATQPDAITRGDGLELVDCFITAAARCAPPGNKPSGSELDRCAAFLVRELCLLDGARVYLALGRVAYDRLLRTLVTHLGREDVRSGAPPFAHGLEWRPDARSPWILCSYHPSRQNTQTGRLSRPMFHAVFRRARRLLDTG